jgi:hypothetical protein
VAHNINLNIIQSPTPHFYLSTTQALPRNGKAIDFIKRVLRDMYTVVSKKDGTIMDGLMDVLFSN